MARSRFPADEFGMDFHISHLQFYRPEAPESDEEDGGGESQQAVDLETALQLSIGRGKFVLSNATHNGFKLAEPEMHHFELANAKEARILNK